MYFRKFPIIEYNGKQVRDITARVALTTKSVLDIRQYQPYDLPEGMRADELAFDYYGSSTQDWLLYLANEIIDPYYGWPLERGVFEDFVVKKYGSLQKALQGTHHYQVNYKGDSTLLDTVAYESLSAAKKFYWTIDTITDTDGIVSYRRKPLELTVATNKVIELNLNTTSSLIVDERIRQYSGLTLVGSAQIAKIVNSTAILVEKVVGVFSNGTTNTSQSSVSKTITDQTVISVNISETAPNDVSVYWEPVSYYDFEFGENEKLRHIFAIDRLSQSDVDTAVQNLLINE